jgi:hypothetical protein
VGRVKPPTPAENQVRVFVGEMVADILRGGIRAGVVFLSPKFRIKATTRKYRHDGKIRPNEILLTLGKPNAREREYLNRKKREYPLWSFHVQI